MTKKLDETTIMNELRGNSAFFPHATAEKTADQPIAQPNERTEKRPEYRTDHLPIKRRTKRYSFEFYDDQVMQLKRLKRDAEDRGENLTLSEMAREALDQYLKRTGIRTEKRSE